MVKSSLSRRIFTSRGLFSSAVLRVPSSAGPRRVGFRMFSSIYERSQTGDDSTPTPTPIEELEAERDEFYRKRNLEIYGYDDYQKPDADKYIEPEVLEKPVVVETFDKITKAVDEFDEVLAHPIKGHKKAHKKDGRKQNEKINAEQAIKTMNRIVFLISTFASLATALYLYSRMYDPYMLYCEVEKEVKKNPKVEQISNKTLWGEKGVNCKVVVKPNKTLTYKELEDIVVPIVKAHPSRRLNPERLK